MTSYDFAGRTALITGAAGGIGSATALAFAQAGANVAVALPCHAQPGDLQLLWRQHSVGVECVVRRCRTATRRDELVLAAFHPSTSTHLLEQFLRTGDGEVLDIVDDFAATVVTLAGESLSVLVGEHGADRLHDRG